VSTAAYTSEDNHHDQLLKTIRLSKNIFSLTERLPKSKYNSPKGGIASGQTLLAQNQTTMPPLKGTLSKHQSTMLNKQDTLGKGKNKSRLQEYLDQ